jgi:D-alanyl-D-alanine carboxypeptidase/D-alanyl-D-alanine-endopeptidase (penicillin-binding protein 4)
MAAGSGKALNINFKTCMIKKHTLGKPYLLIACAFILATASSCTVSKKITKNAGTALIIDSAVRNAHIGISVYDPAEKKFIYSHNADKYFVPASNVKLITLYAGMKILRDSLPGIKYALLENGNLLIQGSGDPTFLHPDFTQHPVYDFLKTKRIRLILPSYTTHMGKGWAWDDYQEYYSAQRAAFPIYGNIIQIKKQGRDSVTLMPRYFNQFKTIHQPFITGLSVRKNFDNNTSLQFSNGT